MEGTKTWPRLYGEGSNGGTKEWEIEVVLQESKPGDAVQYESPETTPAVIYTTFGATGSKMQKKLKVISEGKNIGKKNETTPFQQARADAQSDYEKKIKKGYRHSVAELQGLMDVGTALKEGASAAKVAHPLDIGPDKYSSNKEVDRLLSQGKPIRPMKAETYQDRKKAIVYPARSQPKIDGHRAYGHGGILLSSGGDPVPGLVNMPHIKEELEILQEILPQGKWPDGELYSTEVPFGMLSGCIRRAKRKEGDEKLLPLVKFFAFDVFDPGDPEWPDEDREMVLLEALTKSKYAFKHIIFVPGAEVNNETEFFSFHDYYVQAGYEGAMIRNKRGVYKIGHRSAEIQKYKNFLDKEYKIVGFKEGTGDDAGTVVWLCENDIKPCDEYPEAHPTFSVRPMGSRAYRADLFDHGNDYIGKMLTVRYQNLTEYGIPRFPVGKGIREKGE